MPKQISTNLILILLFAIIFLSLNNCTLSKNYRGYGRRGRPYGGLYRKQYRTRLYRRHLGRQPYPYWYNYYYNKPSRYYWWNRLQRIWPWGNYTPNYYYY